MPIAVTCQCGKTYAAPDGSEGKRLVCPACHFRIPIPAVGPRIEPGPGTHQAGGVVDQLLIAIASLAALGVLLGSLGMLVAAAGESAVIPAFWATSCVCLTVALAGLAASRRG